MFHHVLLYHHHHLSAARAVFVLTSSWQYGPDEIVALQEGYHPQAAHLTHYNHLFFWRYYAGFALALFFIAYWKVVRAFVERSDIQYLVLFVLMTGTLIGSPTHLIIKWRPMHATPLLGYQVEIGRASCRERV